MFGIDAGELIRLELNGQVEYLGRAINVASRLQSYTKELPVGHQLQGNFLQEFVQLTGSATNRPGG